MPDKDRRSYADKKTAQLLIIILAVIVLAIGVCITKEDNAEFYKQERVD